MEEKYLGPYGFMPPPPPICVSISAKTSPDDVVQACFKFIFLPCYSYRERKQNSRTHLSLIYALNMCFLV